MICEQIDLFLASASNDIEPRHKKITEEDLQKAHDKKYEVKPLTPKEWEVYRLIYHNSVFENRRTTQREIYEKVSGFKWNDSPTCHDHCPAIWNVITRNNLSGEHEKIIISFEFEYWIGSKEETQVFLDMLWQDIEPKLMRYWRYCQKVKQDGQGKLIFKENSRAREFVESFIGGSNE